MPFSQHMPRRARVIIAALLCLHAAHGALGFGGEDVNWFFANVVYDALVAAALVVLVLRVRREPAERRAWTFIAAGTAVNLVGELLWSAGLGDPDGSLTVCDAFYAGAYPLLLVGFVLLARGHLALRQGAARLDALSAALAVGAAGVAFVLTDLHEDASNLALLPALLYPVLDLVLFAVVVAVISSQGSRLERRWLVVGAGLGLAAVADGLYYAAVDGSSSYVEGGLLDTLWPLSVLLIAHAATMERERGRRVDAPSLVLPCGLALVSIVVLATEEVRTLASWLACGALVAILLRALLTFRENERLLGLSRREALTDGLTGLPNRRALGRDLEDTLAADRPATLLFFDLDGFKLFNDTFGHPAGDALLVRLGRRLQEAVADAGTAYRMGGDEFCALLDGDPAPTFRAELSLRERGEDFDVSASLGSVALPREAHDPIEALRIADQRLYVSKEHRRASTGAQTCDALLRVLDERTPELHDHSREVALVAEGIAQRLGLAPDAVAEVRRAAELHDVGKLALPDLLLHSSAPLTAEERSRVEQHSLVGERILAAAPSLRAAARVVRATHERWDGDGYPDGLTGEEIPLGARIVAVADAYDAMTTLRPHQAPVPRREALGELQRCAGAQFDPRVVEALAAMSPTEDQPRSLPSRSRSST